MSHSTPTPVQGAPLDPQTLSFESRIALVNYGMQELRRMHNGFAAIEQMLRRGEGAEEPDRLDLFCHDLANLFYTLNTAFEEKIEFLIDLAEANQRAISTQGA